MKKITVIILNWNGKHFLEKFLPKLIETNPDELSEIIIADNASTDDSISFLEQNYPKLRIIKFNQNHGFTGGYNLALSQIKTDYYVLLNSDVETTENWLSPLLDFMEKNQDYAAVQPKILSYDRKGYFEYAGAAGGFMDKYGYPFCRGRILDTVERDLGQYDDICDIFWASGACMFVRAKDWNKAQGLDNHFFAHMEEIDLCWRWQNMGKKIAYIPDSKIYHVGGGTLPNTSPFKLYLNHRNNLYLLYKNLPNKQRNKIMFLRLLFDGISALMYILQRKFYGIRTVLKAHRDFYKNKKNLNRFETIRSYPKTILQKSILWHYFVKSKKKFTNLEF